jgi:hypothetical protein
MGLAMHNYFDTHHQLPPAAVCGPDGTPLLSWRVLILPFIEQDPLYRQFHLDEPWDSPHNIELVNQMPPVFGPYRNKRTYDGMTYFRAIVGPGAAFEGCKGLKFSDFKDGTSNTMLIAEAWDPVPWTKPEELVYDPNGPLPRFGGIIQDGTFRALFADGSVHTIKKEVREESIRALITRDGGDTIDYEECPP